MFRLASAIGARRRVAEHEREHGAAAVIVALFLVVLLGMAAIAIDVGAAYAEKAQLQNGADATALAIASDCANGAVCSVAMAASGNLLADDNANDGSSGLFSITQPSSSSVRVETNAQEVGSTEDRFSLFFARALGIDSAVIHAAAIASWGPPDSGSTLPWTVSECVFRQSLTPDQLNDLDTTGTFSGDPMGTHILLRYDERAPTYDGCEAENGLRPGGFGWLDPNADCSTDIDIDIDNTVDGRPGNSFPTVPGDPAVCDEVLEGILDEPVLIPLFDSATDAGGNRTRYTLIGFAAFEVTGYKFGGSLNVYDPEAPACTGNCRGLMGFFTRFVTLAEGGIDTGGGDDFGANRVALTG